MDAEYNKIIKRLERKRNTHPNLVNYWIKFLYIKNKHYKQVITDSKDILRKINDIQDFKEEHLILLTLLRLNSSY